MSTTTPVKYEIDRDGVTVIDGDREYEVTATELKEAGWMRECDRFHCDDGECPEPDVVLDVAAALEPLKRWHDEESGHSGPYRFCSEAPCATVTLEELL